MKKKPLLTQLLILGFLLGIQDGCIALWRDGNPDPEVFPYRAEHLPIADQKALEKGIFIAGEEELARLIEDYLS